MVLMLGSFYLLIGFAYYIVWESHSRQRGRVAYFSLSETLVIIVLWPFCALFELVRWFERH